MSQAIQMPSLTQEPQLLDMTIESLFLQVLKECIELIPGNLSNPQPRHVLTNLMEAITYPLCFEDRHPQEATWQTPQEQLLQMVCTKGC